MAPATPVPPATAAAGASLVCAKGTYANNHRVANLSIGFEMSQGGAESPALISCEFSLLFIPTFPPWSAAFGSQSGARVVLARIARAGLMGRKLERNLTHLYIRCNQLLMR